MRNTIFAACAAACILLAGCKNSTAEGESARNAFSSDTEAAAPVPADEAADGLGAWNESHFEGVLPAADCPGIRYELCIRSREHSGDGSFRLDMTYLEAEDGKDVTYSYSGSRNTQRGIPGNNDATVWQLVADDGSVFNFLYDAGKQSLTLLSGSFEPVDSDLNYTLERID